MLIISHVLYGAILLRHHGFSLSATKSFKQHSNDSARCFSIVINLHMCKNTNQIKIGEAMNLRVCWGREVGGVKERKREGIIMQLYFN